MRFLAGILFLVLLARAASAAPAPPPKPVSPLPSPAGVYHARWGDTDATVLLLPDGRYYCYFLDGVWAGLWALTAKGELSIREGKQSETPGQPQEYTHVFGLARKGDLWWNGVPGGISMRRVAG